MTKTIQIPDGIYEALAQRAKHENISLPDLLNRELSHLIAPTQTAAVASRNSPDGFAARTRKNLLAIEKLKQQGGDVHAVTQLVNSLLGLIVFPQQGNKATNGTLLT